MTREPLEIDLFSLLASLYRSHCSSSFNIQFSFSMGNSQHRNGLKFSLNFLVISRNLLHSKPLTSQNGLFDSSTSIQKLNPIQTLWRWLAKIAFERCTANCLQIVQKLVKEKAKKPQFFGKNMIQTAKFLCLLTKTTSPVWFDGRKKVLRKKV